MRKQRYDVIVVGCGPGGANAGKFAALNGADTLVVEEKRQIGFPVYDSMSIIYSKSEMEETIGEKIDSAMIYAKAGGLSYIAPSGKEGKVQPLADGFYINRQLLEKQEAIGAIRAGAEIALHTRVVDLVKEQGRVKGVVVRDGSQLKAIPCSVVIAADGCFRLIGEMAGIKVPRGKVSESLGAEFAGVKCLEGYRDIDEIYLDDSGEGMYRYVVQYGKDRITMGCGVGRLAVKQKRSTKQRLAEFIKHLEAIGRYDFSKASMVNMMVGGMGLAAAPNLAGDGIMLIGNAAGGPVYGSRWGGTGLMLGAAWTGRVAAEISAQAVKKGDVSGKSLETKYKAAIEGTLKGEGPRIAGSVEDWRAAYTLSTELQERAVEEIGGELAALHFYSKGALPLRACLEPVQEWLRKRKK